MRAEADRLGVTAAADVTVLGDGAEWIWNLAADVLPQAAGVLDVYHAAEHIAAAAAGRLGDGTAEAAARRPRGGRPCWPGARRGSSGGSPASSRPCRPGRAGTRCGTWRPTSPRTRTRLGYADRLAAGRTIGSGLVEGSVKQLVNRRLKLTGARWRVDHVGPLVELAALIDTPDWHAFWSAA